MADNGADQGIYLLRTIDSLGCLLLEPFFLLNPGPDEPKEFTILYPKDRSPANSAMFEILKRYFTFIPLDDFTDVYGMSIDDINLYNRQGERLSVYRKEWGLGVKGVEKAYKGDFSGPLSFFSLTADEVEQGREVQEKLGIPEDTPFVGIHLRQGGGHSGQLRDTDITSLMPAIEYLLEQGFRVVRLGRTAMNPLPSRPGIVDLPQMEDIPHIADIWFSTQCKFMICDSSGPLHFPLVFNGPPRLIVNYVELMLPSFNPMDRHVSKCFRVRNESNRLMTFKEMMFFERIINISDTRISEANLEIMELTPEDYLDLVTEMVMDLKAGTCPDTNSPLQVRYREIANNWHELKTMVGSMESRHVCPVPPATSFLQKYPELLESI